MKNSIYSRIISSFLILTVLMTMLFCSIVSSNAITQSISANGRSIEITTTKELKNWQQTDSPWGSYYVTNAKGTFPNNNIWCTGCGIVSLCNAVHYATGFWMNPTHVAEWGNVIGGYQGDYTEGEILYPKFIEAFTSQLGITSTNSSGEYQVIQYLGDSSKTVMANRIKNEGVTFVAHVYNHFISIVDYNSKTDKFLVWDNAAGNQDNGAAGYTTNRNGITHFSGDWMTFEQFRGTLANVKEDKSKFKVDYVIPIVPIAGKQNLFVSRDDLMFGSTKLQNSGECCNFTPVNYSNFGGKTLDFIGSLTSLSSITKIGYKINGGQAVWNDSFLLSATSAATSAGKKMVGSSSYTKNFNVKVPVNSDTTRVDILVQTGGETRTIWTSLKENTSGTGVIYAEPAKFVARDEIICDGKYPINQHGNFSEVLNFDFKNYLGKEVSFCGWLATKAGSISSFGYSVDGGSIKYNSAYKSTVSSGAQGHADSQLGTPNYTGYFTVPVVITDTNSHIIKLYAKVASSDVLLWTIKATSNNTTPKPATATPKTTAVPKTTSQTNTTPVPYASLLPDETENPQGTQEIADFTIVPDSTKMPDSTKKPDSSEIPSSSETVVPTENRNDVDSTAAPTEFPSGKSPDDSYMIYLYIGLGVLFALLIAFSVILVIKFKKNNGKNV